MKLEDIKIGNKLIGSFLLITLLLAVVGSGGLVQLRTVAKSADIILLHEVPVADAVMEAKTQIIKARDLLAEYMLEVDLGKLGRIQNEYDQTMKKFDDFADAVIKGGALDGITIIATDSK
ncbi:MAG: MCP four helix bundle domain-containing protein, partial [bacterium]